MDAIFCLRCFCTEKREKRVPPNKLQSIRIVQQGREYKKKKASVPKPGNQTTGPQQSKTHFINPIN